MEHKTHTGKKGTVHYWLSGQGAQCVVFTHGATMDHDLFRYQVDEFSDDYKVIVWDVPAHGLSRPHPDFTLEEAADTILDILDDEGIATAHFVGQSMGGYISQYIARDHPNRVSSLTAVDSSPMQPSYYSPLDIWLLGLTPPLLRLYPYQSLIQSIAKQIALTEEARTYALETLETYSKGEIAAIMTAVSEGVKGYEQEIVLPIPVLIVYGESDQTGKIQSNSIEWAKREQRPLEIIRDASHNANMDNPLEFNQILSAFLKNPGHS